MPLVDTMLGGGLAVLGGIAGAAINQWLGGRHEETASQRELEDQRRAALRAASAHYSQLAVSSSNATAEMLKRFQKSPASARVDRNPALAAKLIGALGEVLLLTTSVEVADLACGLRWQLKVVFEQMEAAIDTDGDTDDAMAIYESIRPGLVRASDLRATFLNAVRQELGLASIIASDLGVTRYIPADRPADAPLPLPE